MVHIWPLVEHTGTIAASRTKPLLQVTTGAVDVSEPTAIAVDVVPALVKASAREHLKGMHAVPRMVQLPATEAHTGLIAASRVKPEVQANTGAVAVASVAAMVGGVDVVPGLEKRLGSEQVLSTHELLLMVHFADAERQSGTTATARVKPVLQEIVGATTVSEPTAMVEGTEVVPAIDTASREHL